MSELVLAGDIGGTKTILQLVRARRREPGDTRSPLVVVAERKYPSQDYRDLAPMVRRFFREVKLGSARVPCVARACFGIAGPVINRTAKLGRAAGDNALHVVRPVIDQTAKLTNLKWFLSARRLERQLGLGRVTLLNDFAAIGQGLAGLEATDLAVLQPGQPDPASPSAVIGAGTGLGEGFRIPDGVGGYHIFPCEGGHTDFPARSALEAQLLSYLRRRHGVTQISVERVVSGPGIASIYDFLCEQALEQETPSMAKVRRRWLRQADRESGTVDLSAAVSEAALASGEALCRQAMRVFVGAYGAEAGNLALKVLCKGGLYVAGGVAPKILPLLQDGTFIEAFRNKGRMRPLMESIPVSVVLNPKVGLIGAALCAVQGV